MLSIVQTDQLEADCKGPFHQRQLTLTVGFLRTLTSS